MTYEDKVHGRNLSLAFKLANDDYRDNRERQDNHVLLILHADYN